MFEAGRARPASSSTEARADLFRGVKRETSWSVKSVGDPTTGGRMGLPGLPRSSSRLRALSPKRRIRRRPATESWPKSEPPSGGSWGQSGRSRPTTSCVVLRYGRHQKQRTLARFARLPSGSHSAAGRGPGASGHRARASARRRFARTGRTSSQTWTWSPRRRNGGTVDTHGRLVRRGRSNSLDLLRHYAQLVFLAA